MGRGNGGRLEPGKLREGVRAPPDKSLTAVGGRGTENGAGGASDQRD